MSFLTLRRAAAPAALLAMLAAPHPAAAAPITYTGQLLVSGSPVSGTYDLQFRVYTALTGGSQNGSTVTVTSVPVKDGVFFVEPNFGSIFLGQTLYLQTAYRVHPSSGDPSYTTVSPRTLVPTSAYALYSANTAALQGKTLSTTAPDTGQVLTWNGSQWTPANAKAGPQGPAGPTGPKGSTGATGPQGPAGTPGTTFTTGNGLSLSGSTLSVVGPLTLSGGGSSAVTGSSTSLDGIVGSSTASNRSGVYGYDTASNANGVSGQAGSNGNGVYGYSASSGTGVVGQSSTGTGVYGHVTGSGTAVVGNASSGVGGSFSSGGNDGVQAITSTAAHSGLFADNTGGGDSIYAAGDHGGNGVEAHTTGSGSAAVYASNDAGGNALHASSSGIGNAYLLGTSDYNAYPFGVYANIAGDSSGNCDAVIGVSSAAHGNGVYGTSYTGVYGYSGAQGGTGVEGRVDDPNNSSDAYGIFGVNDQSNGFAGYFIGNVYVNGTLSASTKDFKIDHPLDPENKYLVHASVESSEMEDIYSGNVKTDANGNATVRLPDWFQALNGDFRYQLTVIGQFAQAAISHEIAGNQFSLKTDKPGVKVSWQVTGVRHDAFAMHHPMTVEEDKPDAAKGTYLDPASFGMSKTHGENYARLMKMRGKAVGPAASTPSEADTSTP